eukprot:CFRG8527T1
MRRKSGLPDIRTFGWIGRIFFTAVGTLEFRAIQEPIRNVRSVQEFFQAKVREIDFDKQEITGESVFSAGDFTVKYDKLVIAVGVKTNTFNTKNVLDREGKEVFFLKNLWHARSIRSRSIEVFEVASLPQVSEEEKKRLLSFVIVGGGPTSCEFASELYDFLQEDLRRLYPELMQYVSVTLFEASDALLGPFDHHLRSYVEKLFKKRRIEVRTSVAVTGVEVLDKAGYMHDATCAMLSDGSNIEFGTMVWSAGLSPVKCTDAMDGRIEKTKSGRIVVDKYLRVKGQEGRVWAIGDCAETPEMPMPLLAQVAQQHAAYLAKVLSGKQGETETIFKFFSLGSMLSIGQWKGIYDGSKVGDPYGWQAKVTNLSGFCAFVTYRTAYWGKQVSMANKLLIPMYWFCSWAFGRDTSRF